MRNRRPSGVRLYVLDAGLIECADYSMFSPSAAPGVFRELSVRSYLVVHPRGTLLWDSGIDDAIAGSVAGRPVTDGIVFRVPRTLRSQLAEIGAAPGAVDYLGLSHLHVDHVGNVGLFPEARVLVQRAEYDAGYGPNPERFTLIPETYAALDHDRIRAIEGDHDLFGDGTVVLTALPGHTPGHQGCSSGCATTGPFCSRPTSPTPPTTTGSGPPGERRRRTVTAVDPGREADRARPRRDRLAAPRPRCSARCPHGAAVLRVRPAQSASTIDTVSTGHCRRSPEQARATWNRRRKRRLRPRRRS